ncbi:hypothetical protein [Serratia symbiotica]|uniref:hypothetical protein n=1 Tax=Serratia symbiotica TaxID=138074 RepID=UPI003464599A
MINQGNSVKTAAQFGHLLLGIIEAMPESIIQGAFINAETDKYHLGDVTLKEILWYQIQLTGLT